MPQRGLLSRYAASETRRADADRVERRAMSTLSVVVLALGLAMDATAVAGARGLAAKRVRHRDAGLVALFFGGSQALMPVIGWAAGATFAATVSGWAHWVVFVVLGGIGAKMLHEARRGLDDPVTDSSTVGVFDPRMLSLLAVATSIDALAAGVTLGLARVNVAFACAVIGIVTAVLSFAGVHAGRRFGTRLGKRLEVLGGLILIGLGVKALVAHFYGGT